MTRKQSYDDAALFMEHNIHIPTRTIYLGSASMDENNDEDGVNFILAEQIIKGLHILDGSATDKEIVILLNNPGGSVTEGMAIFDAIKGCKNPVTIKVFGKCWSMGGYILQSADRRVMTQHSSFMLHEGYTGYPSNHPRIVKKWFDYDQKQDKMLFDLYLRKIREVQPKFQAKTLEDMLLFDTILSPEETKALGLCDDVED